MDCNVYQARMNPKKCTRLQLYSNSTVTRRRDEAKRLQDTLRQANIQASALPTGGVKPNQLRCSCVCYFVIF